MIARAWSVASGRSTSAAAASGRKHPARSRASATAGDHMRAVAYPAPAAGATAGRRTAPEAGRRAEGRARRLDRARPRAEYAYDVHELGRIALGPDRRRPRSAPGAAPRRELHAGALRGARRHDRGDP